ncbi:MAG: N-formylglutamate amidohydrolase, partial [Pseudomonadota bacterium]
MAGLGNVYDHLRAGRGRFILVADHASNDVPDTLKNLGLARDILTRHIAWDIGTAALTNALSAALDCEAVLSKVSRLVVDKNRRIDQP